MVLESSTLRNVALHVEGKDTLSEIRKVDWKALDRKVMVVAVEGHAGDWAAYIGAVEGEDHEEEWKEVADHGSKLPRELAKK